MIRKFFKGLLLLIVIALIALFAWGYAADVPVAELKAKYANAESEFVDLGGGLTVHLRDEGPQDAPAIILLHGSNSQLQTWDEWTAKLKDKYRIIRLDLPGHGITGPDPKDDYSIAASISVIDRLAGNRGRRSGGPRAKPQAWRWLRASPCSACRLTPSSSRRGKLD